MWLMGSLEGLIRALPASLFEQEVLYALTNLQRGEFSPDGLHPGDLSTLHHGEFSSEGLPLGGEGLHPISQGLYGDIRRGVVVVSHTVG